jgi:hypothetical protein
MACEQPETPACAFEGAVRALRIILLDDEYVDSLDLSVFRILTPPDDPSQAEPFERRMNLLNDSQRDALARYIAWYSQGESNLPGRDRALEYWGH